ncbi:MAG: hypothetical protein RL095_1944 [Verrucomicrobiota bacterium]|jgi:hypothetical protein
MTITFTMTKDHCMAFYDHYFRSSDLIQKNIKTTRWLCIAAMFFVLLLMWDQKTAPVLELIVWIGMSIFTWIRIPKSIMDASKKNSLALISSDSHKKYFGDYDVEVTPSHLKMVTPVGESTINWIGIEKLSRDKDYLFIQFGNSSGLAVPIAEVGKETSEKFYQLLTEKMAR